MTARALEIQERLKSLGLYTGRLDGIISKGGATEHAIRDYQTAHGLQPDGIPGSRTLSSLFPEDHATPATPPSAQDARDWHLGQFDAVSAANLAKAHPLLQQVFIRAREEVEFRVLDATRGRKAQEEAFRTGKSKAKFGQSAHNYSPSVACDLFPAPYNWKDRASFARLAAIVMRIARELGVPLRWGGDWHMDGSKTTNDDWDMPHFELNPWRNYVTSANLVP